MDYVDNRVDEVDSIDSNDRANSLSFTRLPKNTVYSQQSID